MKSRKRRLEPLPAQGLHPLAFERKLRIGPDRDTLEITNPEGLVELQVRCTPEGCELRFASAQLALSTPGSVQVRCREWVLEAEQRLELNSGGDFASRIGGSVSTAVSGRVETEADELFLRTRRGDALVQANDYVRLVGEKVLLNSEQQRRPTCDELEAYWRGAGL